MWLLPAVRRLSSLAANAFYRFEVSGGRVPAKGPVLLVANHPNSLMDPALVAAAAGRPLRFLAKAPLFTDPLVGWLVRGAGSIPVYRRSDDPAQVGRNEDTFRAVHRALAEGAAIGIFPEGTSHSDPSLAPLHTGAARIALGAAPAAGGAFPILPVGLVFQEKRTFRSEALAVIGEAVPWDDLAPRGADDGAAVRELTARIEAGLRAVTVNLEQWEDQPLVAMAEAVFAAELPHDPSSAARIARLGGAAAALARVRRERPGEWEALAREVRAHARLLGVLGMTPAQVKGEVGLREAGRWTLRQLGVPRLLLPVAALGVVLFYPPFRLTGALEARARPLADVRATWKVLVGAALHFAWTLLLAGAAGWAIGWAAGVGALLVLPLVAGVALVAVDHWRRAAGEARRFMLRRTRAERIAEMRVRQRALAERLREAWESVRA